MNRRAVLLLAVLMHFSSKQVLGSEHFLPSAYGARSNQPWACFIPGSCCSSDTSL